VKTWGINGLCQLGQHVYGEVHYLRRGSALFYRMRSELLLRDLAGVARICCGIGGSWMSCV
jgi:hypothetical protein